MIFRINGYDLDIVVDDDHSATLCIENKMMYRSVVNALLENTMGLNNYDIVLDVDGKAVQIEKYVKILNSPFEVDSMFKTFQTDIYKELESYLLYDQSLKIDLEMTIERINHTLSFVEQEFDYELIHDDEFRLANFMKFMNYRINLDKYPKTIDKFYLYLDLFALYKPRFALVLLNFTSFFTYEELKEISKYCIYKKIKILFIESSNCDKIFTVNNYLIDNDLIEFDL